MVPLELQVDGVEDRVMVNCANAVSPLKNKTHIKATNLFNYNPSYIKNKPKKSNYLMNRHTLIS